MKLPIKQTKTTLDVTFCGNGKCKCPSVSIDKNIDTVVIGGKEEGFTNFTKEQFKLMVEQVKEGLFDQYI